MTYVKTQFGNIHINDIPIVVSETFGSKFKHALIFFSIIVIIIITFLYMQKNDHVQDVEHEEKVSVKEFTDKILTNVKATAIDVYDNDNIYLENIIVITTDNNVINVDILQNKYVKTIQNDDEIVYSIDFKAELDIKEIILGSDENHYIKHINIDLINNGKKVWEYCGFLPDERENSIMISKQVFKPGSWKSDTLDNSADTMDKKIIMNENQLLLQLSEDGENDGFATYKKKLKKNYHK